MSLSLRLPPTGSKKTRDDGAPLESQVVLIGSNGKYHIISPGSIGSTFVQIRGFWRSLVHVVIKMAHGPYVAGNTGKNPTATCGPNMFVLMPSRQLMRRLVANSHIFKACPGRGLEDI